MEEIRQTTTPNATDNPDQHMKTGRRSTADKMFNFKLNKMNIIFIIEHQMDEPTWLNWRPAEADRHPDAKCKRYFIFYFMSPKLAALHSEIDPHAGFLFPYLTPHKECVLAHPFGVADTRLRRSMRQNTDKLKDIALISAEVLDIVWERYSKYFGYWFRHLSELDDDVI